MPADRRRRHGLPSGRRGDRFRHNRRQPGLSTDRQRLRGRLWTHFEFGPFGDGGQPKIRNEYTLLDETAIWKQILLHTG